MQVLVAVGDLTALTPADNDNVYKIIENEHVVIIRDGKRYGITGQKMEN